MAAAADGEDGQLHQLCDELWTPVLDGGWEFFVESHGVSIYRLYIEASGLYEYKVCGSIDVPPDTCAQVYMDINYRKKWDGYVKELREVEENGQSAIYWQINFPFMMSNRDYVYRRQYKEIDYKGHHIYCILAQSVVLDSVPRRSGVIRVTDYLQKFVFTDDGNGGTKAYMHYYDNPGGMIPTFLVNWAAKTGVPGFLKDMQKACRGYADYKAKLT